jgi:hypothetical protein
VRSVLFSSTWRWLGTSPCRCAQALPGGAAREPAPRTGWPSTAITCPLSTSTGCSTQGRQRGSKASTGKRLHTRRKVAGDGWPCATFRICPYPARLRSPNAATAVQVSPPHSTPHLAIITTSTTRSVPCPTTRGSSLSATNRVKLILERSLLAVRLPAIFTSRLLPSPYYPTRWCSMAIATASVRLDTPSLLRMLLV